MIPMAQAQTAAASNAAPNAKVAVIAFEAAVAKTNEGQRNLADLEKKYQPKQEEITTLKNQVDSLTKQLQTDGPKLSDTERASRAKVIDDKTKQLDRTTEDARNDFSQDVNQAYAALASKVYDVMKDYAEKNGYTLVLNISGQQSPVMFREESTDITQAVIDAYNTKSGVPAPTGASSSAVPDAPAPAPKQPAAH